MHTLRPCKTYRSLRSYCSCIPFIAFYSLWTLNTLRTRSASIALIPFNALWSLQALKSLLTNITLHTLQNAKPKRLEAAA